MTVSQRGFGAIMAIVVLVILAALAAGMLTFGSTQQLDSAADLQSVKALSAARSGADAGLFKAIAPSTPADAWKTCGASPGLSMFLDLSASTGFHVAVTCRSWPYNEGESTPGTPNVVRVYRIEAVACNSANACPDAGMATSPGYVERVWHVTATN